MSSLVHFPSHTTLQVLYHRLVLAWGPPLFQYVPPVTFYLYLVLVAPHFLLLSYTFINQDLGQQGSSHYECLTVYGVIQRSYTLHSLQSAVQLVCRRLHSPAHHPIACAYISPLEDPALTSLLRVSSPTPHQHPERLTLLQS